MPDKGSGDNGGVANSVVVQARSQGENYFRGRLTYKNANIKAGINFAKIVGRVESGFITSVCNGIIPDDIANRKTISHFGWQVGMKSLSREETHHL